MSVLKIYILKKQSPSGAFCNLDHILKISTAIWDERPTFESFITPWIHSPEHIQKLRIII